VSTLCFTSAIFKQAAQTFATSRSEPFLVCNGIFHTHLIFQVVKKLGGTVDDTEGFEGLVFAQKVAKVAGGPTRVEKAKIAVLQARAPCYRPRIPLLQPSASACSAALPPFCLW
jgi:chaperonin GroEL (HSP60 family)